MAIFKKKEKTEEEIAAAEQKRNKIKEVAVTTVKVVAGVVAFAVGVLLVAAAMNTDPETMIESLHEGDGDASDPEDPVVDVIVDEPVTEE